MSDVTTELAMEASDKAVEIVRLKAENDRLRKQMERLVTLLRVDCDIDASWDGLRRFWSIELTEGGCLMRDRACKAEAENDRLRDLVRILKNCADENGDCDACPINNAKPVRHPWFGCDTLRDMMCELGIEVDE